MNLGSLLHRRGLCTPCKFFRSHWGCRDGYTCVLCHYPHEEYTYSGIRRLMRQNTNEKRQMLARLQAAAPDGVAFRAVGDAVSL